MRIGAWSDPVEGKVDESHERKAGNICEVANTRSMVLGL